MLAHYQAQTALNAIPFSKDDRHDRRARGSDLTRARVCEHQSSSMCERVDSEQHQNNDAKKTVSEVIGNRSKTTKFFMRALGLEPRTYGLKVRCSTN